MKSEFLMLAHDFNEKKHSLLGFYASEKLDGVRCFWDGGISRGKPAEQIPWCNTAKYARYRNEIICTGLWTRYGHPIQAPGYWLDRLPSGIPLDGELTMGSGTFQLTTSAIKKLQPDPVEWREVKYAVFDAPIYSQVFSPRSINITNFKKEITGCLQWISSQGISFQTAEEPFYRRYYFLKSLDWSGNAYALEQTPIPVTREKAVPLIKAIFDKVICNGGEGLMFRNPTSFWRPNRSYDLLKMKLVNDAEGTVIGYTWGEESDTERTVNGTATNKMLGLMGSVRVRMDSGIEFDLSGFTDAERRMIDKRDNSDATAIGIIMKGEFCQEHIENPVFPRGSRITFKYRELTKDGCPKEARYYRKAE